MRVPVVAILDCIVGEGHLLARHRLQEDARALRTKLMGASPTPLEEVLVERIVVCQTALTAYELKLASTTSGSIREFEFLQRRVDSAHRRLLGAVESLSRVRRAGLATLQVNIAEKQVNVAGG